MHEVKECSKWGQMAGVLYTDQLVIDLFVTSWITLPKVASEGKIQEKNPSFVQWYFLTMWMSDQKRVS